LPDVATLVARRLHEAGCRFAFGIPGGEVLHLIDALERAGIRFVLCKHENAGGFMAAGSYHATGAPAVVVATVGPGVANLVNAVADAYLDRVPMIVLTGCVDAADTVGFTHQILDHRALLAPVVKAGFTLVPEAAGAMVDKALAIATDPRPGPVHLDVPIRVARAEASGPVPRRATPAPVGPAAGAELDAARALLRASRRPIAVAGLDILARPETAARVASLLERFEIPLITTYKAKGVLPEDHPLALGAAGLSPRADAVLLPLLGRSDCVLLLGYDPVETRAGWRDPWPAGAPVIELASLPNTHYVHQARHAFVCDIGAGCEALGRDLTRSGPWPAGEIEEARRVLAAAFPADEAWGPAAVIDTARRVWPEDGLATVDTGAHRILLSQIWRCARPHTLLQSTGLCTMGCALPLAIGHALARGGEPVLAFTGDAGLEMVLGELATARDLALPVVVVVFVDEALALIELKQRGGQYAVRGTTFGGTDLAAVAEAMGGRGVTVWDRDRLAAAITEGRRRRGFTLIACPIGARAYDGRF